MNWNKRILRTCSYAAVVAFVLSAGGCPTIDPNVPDDSSEDDIIFSNDNILAVANAPTAATQFTIDRAYRVTSIRNYHWNDGEGTAGPGTIALRAADNTLIGTWSCTALDGQNDTPNAYWLCTPNVDIPAGTYTIEDSDTATWSNNTESGNAGISIVRGTPIEDATAPAAADDIIFSNDNVLAVSNAPTAATQFTIDRSYRVTSIRDYHWNNGQGTAGPGTIALRAADNTLIGTWTCMALDGQNDTPNAYWLCTPYVDIPAGTYTIEDSDTATWSNNSESDNAGISIVRGAPI